MEDQDKLEYQELGQLFRKYTDFLISIMQNFIGANGLFFIGLSFISKDGTITQRLFITLLGFCGCIGALIIQIRTFRYWNTILKRGVEMDQKFKLSLYDRFYSKSKSTWFRSAHFAVIIYSIFSIFWLFLFLKACGLDQIRLPL